MKTITGCVLLLALTAPAGAAAQKTPVRVTFEIRDRVLRNLFTDDVRSSVEADAARLLADNLESRLPVLDLTTDSADYTLALTLNLRGGDHATVADHGFYARLQGPDSSTDATWWAMFREADEIQALLDEDTSDEARPAEFLKELTLKVTAADLGALVRDHLSRVPIASDGRVFHRESGGVGWVATQGRDGLCLGLDTGMRVLVLAPSEFSTNTLARYYHARVKDDFEPAVVFDGDPPPEFGFVRGFIIFPDPEDQAGLDEVAGDEDVRVAGFYVVHFLKDETICDDLATTAQAEAGVGGAP